MTGRVGADQCGSYRREGRCHFRRQALEGEEVKGGKVRRMENSKSRKFSYSKALGRMGFSHRGKLEKLDREKERRYIKEKERTRRGDDVWKDRRMGPNSIKVTTVKKLKERSKVFFRRIGGNRVFT